MDVGLIGIAGKEKLLVICDPPECFIFRAIDLKRRLVSETGDRDAAGIAGEQIFGQHNQLHRRAAILLHEDRRGPDLGRQALNH